MTSETHDAHIDSLHRLQPRQGTRFLDRSWGSGFTALRARQLAVLAGAVSVLIGLIAPTTGGAAAFGHRAVPGREVHAVQSSVPKSRSARLASHHRWHRSPAPPPPTTTVPPTTTGTGPTTPWPVGVTDATEPSGMAPPDADAISGYTQSYVQDFNGGSLPSGWTIFTGQPGGTLAPSGALRT